jgi:hypothetical protein
MAERPARETDENGRLVHPALAESPYPRSELSEEDLRVPTADLSASQVHLGAPPIRWGWWAAGMVLSAGLWACLALLLLLFWL